MPNDRETPAASSQRRPAAGAAHAQGNRFWNIVGAVFAWVVAMALWQKGFTGYLLTFVVLYAAFALAGAVLLVRWTLRRHAAPVCAVGLLLAWWDVGGTYAWQRDAVLGSAVFLIVLLVFPSSRLWVKRVPSRLGARYRLWRMRQRHAVSAAGLAEREANAGRLAAAMRRGVASFGERLSASASRGADVTPVTVPLASARPPVRPALHGRTLALAALAVWIALSGADRLFESRPLPRASGVVHPPAMVAAYAPLHVGLAMSGGGYRAALVHAGVVDALGSLGIPVTHISSVSGGSIIGGYLAVGGAPRDFLQAVIGGRFRMTRDLLAAQNLVRLPSPTVLPWLGVDVWPFFGSFSRLDVQADLVDRVLLAGTMANARLGPRLMVCMTDLNHGLSVGATDNGVLLAGPTTARYFRSGLAIDFPAMPRLADRVAVSGAFPGAFPTLPVQARIARHSGVQDLRTEGTALDLQLADGGVRDNLGLGLLEAIDRLAREPQVESGLGTWNGFRPDADWQLDVMLVSDGGKFLQSEVPAGLLGQTIRAIDLSGLATGVTRPMAKSADDRLVVLSALNTIAPGPDAVVLGMGTAALRDAHHAYFRPDMLGDDVVERMLAMQPDAARLGTAWQMHRRAAAKPIDPSRLAAACAAPRTSPVEGDADCAWWSVVSAVGEDIWRATETFARTPTLSDVYTAEQAQTIFRFGQYLAYLQAPKLRAALARAAAARPIRNGSAAASR